MKHYSYAIGDRLQVKPNRLPNTFQGGMFVEVIAYCPDFSDWYKVLEPITGDILTLPDYVLQRPVRPRLLKVGGNI